MGQELVPAADSARQSLETAVAKAADFAAASKAIATLRAYGSDWADFAAWCERHQVERLPAAPGVA